MAKYIIATNTMPVWTHSPRLMQSGDSSDLQPTRRSLWTTIIIPLGKHSSDWPGPEDRNDPQGAAAERQACESQAHPRLLSRVQIISARWRISRNCRMEA